MLDKPGQSCTSMLSVRHAPVSMVYNAAALLWNFSNCLCTGRKMKLSFTRTPLSLPSYLNGSTLDLIWFLFTSADSTTVSCPRFLMPAFHSSCIRFFPFSSSLRQSLKIYIRFLSIQYLLSIMPTSRSRRRFSLSLCPALPFLKPLQIQFKSFCSTS